MDRKFDNAKPFGTAIFVVNEPEVIDGQRDKLLKIINESVIKLWKSIQFKWSWKCVNIDIIFKQEQIFIEQLISCRKHG